MEQKKETLKELGSGLTLENQKDLSLVYATEHQTVAQSDEGKDIP